MPITRRILLSLVMGLLALTASAPTVEAHEASKSAIVLVMAGDHVDAHLEHPLGALGQAMGIDLTPENVLAEHRGSVLAYLETRLEATSPDGTPWIPTWGDASVAGLYGNGVPYLVVLVRLDPPSGLVGPFGLRSSAILDEVPSHSVMVTIQDASGPARLVGLLDWSVDAIQVNATPSNWQAFTAMARSGMDHIRGGLDHILFLLVLLVPAPLLVVGHRWQPAPPGRRSIWRVVHVVTAFTIGHSLTLVASALGWVKAPAQPVEVLIGVSILVGAVHAWRPLVRGGESWIAGLFGMVHGLAFARILASLGLTGTWGAVALFGFNVGVEAMQLVVVALVFPSFYLLARSTLYPAFRRMASLVTGLAALGWIAARIGLMRNVLAPLEGLATAHLVAGAGALAAFAVVAWRLRPASETLVAGRDSIVARGRSQPRPDAMLGHDGPNFPTVARDGRT